jgi:carotenoid cleavage dioxygenase
MVHGVRLRGGEAEWYRNRLVRTETVANTNVIEHAGKTWAIVEAGNPPVELTHDLETVGVSDFGSTLDGSFTAHPKRDPLTGELHAVVYHWSWEHLRYLVVGTDGRVRRQVDVPVPGRPMVHDCAITESAVLLFDLPCTFDLDLAMSGVRFPYRWDPDYGARVGVLPFDGEAGDVRWYDVEPCYVFHPLNAYDAPDGSVVVDLVRHPKMFDTHRLWPNEGAPTLDRWTIDPTSGKVREERIDDRGQEFPRLDERLVGRRHRYGYGAGFTTLTEGIDHGPALKHDLTTGTTEVHDYGAGRVTLEPVFVPRSADADEDDGWVLSYVYDATTDTSDVVILHARDFTGGPVATVHLPRRVPFGFHGNWVPDRS